MPQQPPTRFDDLLLDAVSALQTLARRGKGWDEAPSDEKGRVVELGRGLAGERRYAKQVGDEPLVELIDALKGSAEARLRMLEGRTKPGDEELAEQLDRDTANYRAVAQPSDQ